MLDANELKFGYDRNRGSHWAIVDCFADERAAVGAAELCAAAAMPTARFVALFQPHSGWMVQASGFASDEAAAAALAPAAALRDGYEAARRAFLRDTDCAACGVWLIKRGLDCGLRVFRRGLYEYVCGDCADAGDARVADFAAESDALVERLKARDNACATGGAVAAEGAA